MANVYDKIKPYIDKDGYVQNKMQPPEGWFSGNGPLRTAEAVVLLDEELTPALKEQFVEASAKCWDPVVGYMREPSHWRDSQDSPDNAVGHLIIATWCDAPTLARRWIERGREGFKLRWWPFRWRYYFPNEPQYQKKFGWRAWFGKFLSVRCGMCWTAEHFTLTEDEAKRYAPGFFLRWGWILTIATTGWFGSGQDPWILSNLMVHHAVRLRRHLPDPASGSNRWINWAVQRFCRLKKKKWPDGLGECYALYFRENEQSPPNYNHWLPQVLREKNF